MKDGFIRSWLSFSNMAVLHSSNEKSYQAWFASYLIQEFGMSRVYREIHLLKSDFAKLNMDFPAALNLVSKGNELFPDVCVSRMQHLDTRHSASRKSNVSACEMLDCLDIVSELKVGFSSNGSTAFQAIYRDIVKLGIFGSSATSTPLLFMCVLDDTGRINDDYIDRLCIQSEEWPVSWTKPDILVTQNNNGSWECFVLDGHSNWKNKVTVSRFMVF